MRKKIFLIALFALLGLVAFLGCDDDKVVNTGASGPDGRLYVLNQGDNTMYIYDTKTMEVLDTVETIIDQPHYIDFSPDGLYYYISTLGIPGQMAKFNLATNAFIDSVRMPASVQPSAFALTNDGAYGYVCNFTDGPGKVIKFDMATLDSVGFFNAGSMTHDLKSTSDGELVVAVSRKTDNVFIYDAIGDSMLTVLHMNPEKQPTDGGNDYGPFGVEIDHNDSIAYIACIESDEVRMLDLTTMAIVDSIDIPVIGTAPIVGPTLMAVSPDNDIVYVTTNGGRSVVAFRVSTKEILADNPIETEFSFGISISDDGSRVYAATFNQSLPKIGRVYIFDGPTGVKIDSLDVGSLNFGLRFLPLAD